MPLVESGREQPVTGPKVLNLHCLQAFAVPLTYPARLDVHAKFPKPPCWQTQPYEDHPRTKTKIKGDSLFSDIGQDGDGVSVDNLDYLCRDGVGRQDDGNGQITFGGDKA